MHLIGDSDITGTHPPFWFWEVIDSIKMGIPLHPAKSIRQVPLFIRWRHRIVRGALEWSRMERARRDKAMGVYDFNGKG